MELTLLSEAASQKIAEAIVEIVEKEVEKRMGQKEKRYLMQKEVIDEYKCCAKTLAKWEQYGLKKFRNGQKWMYDRKDIEETLEKIKQ